MVFPSKKKDTMSLSGEGARPGKIVTRTKQQLITQSRKRFSVTRRKPVEAFRSGLEGSHSENIPNRSQGESTGKQIMLRLLVQRPETPYPTRPNLRPRLTSRRLDQGRQDLRSGTLVSPSPEPLDPVFGNTGARKSYADRRTESAYRRQKHRAEQTPNAPDRSGADTPRLTGPHSAWS